MKLTARQNEIIAVLKKQGYAKVDYLSKKTFISPSSIRRDLQYLENLGVVERDYGGVHLKGGEKTHPPIQIRKDKDRTYKKDLSLKAVRFIHDGNSIFLDSSTTAFYMVDNLSGFKNLTVFTNNLETAMRCIERGICVYVTGGKSLDKTPVLGGVYACETLEKISVDVAFLSSYGIDENGVITDPNEEQNKMRKIMLARSKKTVLMLDKTKIGKSSVHVLCNIKDVDHFITNDDVVSIKYSEMQK